MKNKNIPQLHDDQSKIPQGQHILSEFDCFLTLTPPEYKETILLQSICEQFALSVPAFFLALAQYYAQTAAKKQHRL